MGRVLMYTDYLDRLEKELAEYEAELHKIAEENEVDFSLVLESLDAFEAEYYEALKRTVAHLRLWAAVERGRANGGA